MRTGLHSTVNVLLDMPLRSSGGVGVPIQDE